jgi:hypothetical protein
MILYLKGLHLTIKHWKDDRDEQGWPEEDAINKKRRRTDEEILVNFEEQMNVLIALSDLQEADDASPLQLVTPVPRLLSDVRCLLELFGEETSAVQCVRGGAYASLVYG